MEIFENKKIILFFFYDCKYGDVPVFILLHNVIYISKVYFVYHVSIKKISINPNRHDMNKTKI